MMLYLGRIWLRHLGQFPWPLFIKHCGILNICIADMIWVLHLVWSKSKWSCYSILGSVPCPPTHKRAKTGLDILSIIFIYICTLIYKLLLLILIPEVFMIGLNWCYPNATACTFYLMLFQSRMYVELQLLLLVPSRYKKRLVIVLLQPSPVSLPSGHFARYSDSSLLTLLSLMPLMWCFMQRNPNHVLVC